MAQLAVRLAQLAVRLAQQAVRLAQLAVGLPLLAVGLAYPALRLAQPAVRALKVMGGWPSQLYAWPSQPIWWPPGFYCHLLGLGELPIPISHVPIPKSQLLVNYKFNVVCVCVLLMHQSTRGFIYLIEFRYTRRAGT